MSRMLAIGFVALALLGSSPAAATSLGVASGSVDVFRTCVLTGSSSSATVGVDTYVDQASGTSNFGSATTMGVQAKKNSRNQRSYLRFDLGSCSPAIPAAAAVSDARMNVFVGTIATACRTIDAFAVTATWGEGTITWDNQPFGTAENNPPTSQRSAFTTIGRSPCTYTAANQYVSLSVTADVAAFVTGTSTNYGWMLRDDVEGGAPPSLTEFATKEAGAAETGPQLIITYRP